MRILGISCFYHDAAAALVVDGKVVAAVPEERISRVKHDQELPVKAVQFCLEKASLRINDLDYVVFYDKPVTKFDRILTGYIATPGRSYRTFLKALPVWLRRKLWTDMVIHKELGFDGDILYTTHHLSHAAGAFFSSPFERSAILTIDGVGEWATASYGIGENNRVHLISEMHYPHSVGLLYSAITYYLGFQVNSAEYKVMGLAPYGTPRFAYMIEKELLTIHDDGSIHLNMDYFHFHYGATMTGRKLELLLGQPRRTPESALAPFHNDVAASIQAVVEKIVLKMARHVRKETGCERLCMAGGVALNCKANGLLLRESIFDEIYVQPDSGDSGGAIGAALYAHYKITGDDKQCHSEFGIGPEFSDSEIGDFLEKNDIAHIDLEPEERHKRLAEQIAAGSIVAIYQGAMEFGPRALGFRSILADPRDNLMKEKINAAVKYREKFRPFAPVVLEEYTSEYFECHQPSPYMLFNYQVVEDKRSVIPAVTHVDGSSRIQTVTRNDNPIYYDIIEAFRQITGLPVLLNTSFNLRGHPIAHTPEQAFATFCSGGIDFLLMGRYLIDKQQLPAETVERFVFEKGSD